MIPKKKALYSVPPWRLQPTCSALWRRSLGKMNKNLTSSRNEYRPLPKKRNLYCNHKILPRKTFYFFYRRILNMSQNCKESQCRSWHTRIHTYTHSIVYTCRRTDLHWYFCNFGTSSIYAVPSLARISFHFEPL